MRQDAGAEFISDSLNTVGLLKRASLERKKSDGVYRERSTSSNRTSLALVFLGRFPIRPVSQSASSCGLASWTGQQLYSLAPLGFAFGHHTALRICTA